LAKQSRCILAFTSFSTFAQGQRQEMPTIKSPLAISRVIIIFQWLWIAAAEETCPSAPISECLMKCSILRPNKASKITVDQVEADNNGGAVADAVAAAISDAEASGVQAGDADENVTGSNKASSGSGDDEEGCNGR
jgi:hypothetical protein